jgi:PhzF family phenazine biosynthesis protein
MKLPIVQVDAFTHTPFCGNPAAVCILEADRVLDDSTKQLLAREMNLSETAFVQRRSDSEWNLRWFTPLAEVALCGHATLAAAHVLWEQSVVALDEEVSFHTQSGILTACREDKGEEKPWITLDFPAKEVVSANEWTSFLTEALGVKPLFVGRNDLDFVVEVENEATLRELSPDFGKLLELPMRGLSVTAKSSTADIDFVSRFFAPAVGINEDPVTGSAHCALAPLWSTRLGKSELVAYQASARGGVLRVRPQGNRVLISGQAVTVLRVELEF